MRVSLIAKNKKEKGKKSKVKSVIKGFSITLLVFVIVMIGYILGGTYSKNVSLNYDIKVEKASDGYLNVKMTIKDNKRPFLHLYLNDSKISKSISRISNLEVKRDGKAMASWKALPFCGNVPVLQNVYSIWTGFSNKDIEISYKVLATWDKNRINAIRNNLTATEGYITGWNFLLIPISTENILSQVQRKAINSKHQPVVGLNFVLPENWKVNSPWGDKEIKDKLYNISGAFFYLCDMNIVKNNDTSVPFSLGGSAYMSEDKFKELEKLIVKVIENAKKITGLEPNSRAPYWSINVVNSIKGGMAGTNSLITDDSNVTIAHEIFHWWNGATSISPKKNAEWIREGFTSYYSYKILHNTGYLTEQEFDENMSRLANTYKGLKINLVKNSEKFSERTATQTEIGTIYNGGALIAYYLDKDLNEQNKSLDEIWTKLYALKKTISPEDFFKVLSEIGGEELSTKYRNMVNGKTSF
jgi:predicted metalloprotease with PDZ domain